MALLNTVPPFACTPQNKILCPKLVRESIRCVNKGEAAPSLTGERQQSPEILPLALCREKWHALPQTMTHELELETWLTISFIHWLSSHLYLNPKGKGEFKENQ